MRIETERLVIRSFEPSDLPAYGEIVADPRVTRFLGDGEPYSFARAALYLEDVIARDRTTGVSRYAVLVGDELIGFCGFKEVDDHVDMGWRYAYRHWGMGYATEAARAVLEYGVHTLKLSRIRAAAYQENVESVHVIEKLGFRFLERVDHPRGPIVRYACPADAA